jgi:hypothetical protein
VAIGAAVGRPEPPAVPRVVGHDVVRRRARVTRLLGAHPNPGPGDVNRAVRAALVGLWTPPEGEELQRVGRWNSNAPAFERVSKQAV